MATGDLKFTNESSLIKLSEGAIQVSSDNGETWTTVIDGGGVKGATLNGSLDINNLKIYDKENPTFTWNKDGINAYTHKDGVTNFTKFVRLDQYGVYGVSNYTPASSDTEAYFVPESISDIEETADFGFVWDEFFLKSKHDGGMVKISSEDDIQVMANDAERIKVGKLDDEHYGIRIKNATGNTVMKTTDEGNLELTGKVTAESGSIGGFEIASDMLKADDIDSKIVISPNGIGLGKTLDDDITTKDFYVTPEGELHAKNATIEGTLKTNVLEKDSTSVVGGTVIYKNAGMVDNNRSKNADIYFVNDEGLDDFQVGDNVTIFKSGEPNNKYYWITDYGYSITYEQYSLPDGSKWDDSLEYYYLDEDDFVKLESEPENFNPNDYYQQIKTKTNIVLDSHVEEGIFDEITVEAEDGTSETSYVPNSEDSYMIIVLSSSSGDTTAYGDWLIGVNSTSKEKMGLYRNSITFNDFTLDENEHIVNYTTKVVIGDLSGLELGEEDVKNGLYAENAYLTGSFYANKGSEDNEVSITKDGVSFGDNFYYDAEEKTLKIGSGNYYTQVEDDGFKVFKKVNSYIKYNLDNEEWDGSKDYYELQNDGTYKKLTEEPNNFYANNYYEYIDSINIASFGENVLIGEEEKTHQELTPYTFSMYDNSLNYVIFEDLRGEKGYCEVEEEIIIESSGQKSITLQNPIYNDKIVVLINGEEVTNYTYSVNSITFDSDLNKDDILNITYDSNGEYLKAFTFGKRNPDETKGQFSFVEGYWGGSPGQFSHTEGFWCYATNTAAHAEGRSSKATGNGSHAEGMNTEASGVASHAEGHYTNAKGIHCHAEGSYTRAKIGNSHAEGQQTQANAGNSHAEGCNTIANGVNSHAEGYNTTANGLHSHTQNWGTKTSDAKDAISGQTAIGRFNIGKKDTLFEIGNGKYDASEGETRSNALEVDDSGNTTIAGDLSAVNATISNKLSVSGANVVPFKIEKISLTPSAIKAGNATNVNIDANIYDGYTPVGILGVNISGTHASYLALYEFEIEDGYAKAGYRNNDSDSVTPTVEFTILYTLNQA